MNALQYLGVVAVGLSSILVAAWSVVCALDAHEPPKVIVTEPGIALIVESEPIQNGIPVKVNVARYVMTKTASADIRFCSVEHTLTCRYATTAFDMNAIGVLQEVSLTDPHFSS